MKYESIRLEKGMYGVPGKSFTQVLEGLDPSDGYAGTPMEGLDAYQRQLKRFDIRVGGPSSDKIEKFFQTGDAAALFPEYVSRAVRQGMEQANLLPDLVAATTQIESLDYRTITSDPGEDDRSLKPVAEGAQLPQTGVTVKDKLVKLNKRGRMLVASYEALRFQRLDLFTVTLRQIGSAIARSQLSDAIAVLLSGDGGDEPAETVAAAGTTPVYGDLINLWSGLSPYTLNTMLASTAAMKDLLSIAEFKDATAGLNFQGTGKLISPLGAKLLHAPQMEAGKIIGLDKACALEMVQAGGVTTDSDRLIDRQLERTAVSVTAGFARLFDGAVRVLAYGA
ncbi:phage major capsid protein [Caproicibacter sp.]|uniref:phage major capsid protein n=1 Tax=Caproicibacter sp. TaxID=2814884 RepID=UPI003989869E